MALLTGLKEKTVSLYRRHALAALGMETVVGGGMPLYRGVLQRYPVTGPADLLCAGGGCQRQDEPVRNSIHRLTGDNRCQNPDGPLNKKSSTLPPSGVL
ncbi:TPA: hypothetical protein ACIVVN_005386, partial [Salmonella enterica subsp. enterica serovar Kottbus]